MQDVLSWRSCACLPSTVSSPRRQHHPPHLFNDSYLYWLGVLRQVCRWRTMVTSLGWSWSQRPFAHVSPAMVEIQVHRAKFRSSRVRSHLSWGLLGPPNSTPADSTPVHLWTPRLCACGQTRDVGYVWLPDTLHLLHQRILKEDAKWKPKETGSYDFYFGIILESQQK